MGARIRSTCTATIGQPHRYECWRLFFLNSNKVIILFTIENYCMHVYSAYDRYVNLDSCIALDYILKVAG